jgi:hypothetical protein
LLLKAFMGLGEKEKPKRLDEMGDADMGEFMRMVNG